MNICHAHRGLKFINIWRSSELMEDSDSELDAGSKHGPKPAQTCVISKRTEFQECLLR